MSVHELEARLAEISLDIQQEEEVLKGLKHSKRLVLRQLNALQGWMVGERMIFRSFGNAPESVQKFACSEANSGPTPQLIKRMHEASCWNHEVETQSCWWSDGCNVHMFRYEQAQLPSSVPLYSCSKFRPPGCL